MDENKDKDRRSKLLNVWVETEARKSAYRLLGKGQRRRAGFEDGLNQSLETI